MKSEDYRRKNRERILNPFSKKLTYNKKERQCQCGAWVPKGNWMRVKGEIVVACAACREGKEDV